ncbi:hypothetical protein JCM8202_002351 [Rhodotorula sphaerocarpa]
MRTALALTTALAVGTAAASSFPQARVPSLAFSSPKEFLGLDDGFSQEIGTIFFLPGFHACGTLQILSLDPGFNSPALAESDFDLLPRYNDSLYARWLTAPTRMSEGNSSEGTILAWAKGWHTTCGKGAANKEVRVSRIALEGAQDRAQYAEQIDAQVQPYLAALPAAPHNSVTILTSLSESTLRTLLNSVTPSPGHSGSSGGGGPTRPPLHRERPKHHHNFFARILGRMFDLALLGSLVLALAYAGQWAWRRWQARRTQRGEENRIALGEGDEFGIGGDELRLELDSEEEEEEE